jgi:glutamate-ammonia-ligase adenylyltransferase
MTAAGAAPDRSRHRVALDALAAPSAEEDALFAQVRAYRDRELLKAELDFLLTPERALEDFSSRLQDLAEALLGFTVDTLFAGLARRHGPPDAHALFALGKFGGEELGSGSDLEILLVYAEGGDTAGPESLRRGEFFERLGQGLLRALGTGPGETFALDLRLRPHGESGPLAASLKAWREYFAPGGGALDYEKQALIRLRPVHGDHGLAKKVRVLRDAIAYADPPVPIAHTLELHAQQAALKAKPGVWNAKYSPGGMAELEYAVQFLQLARGC